MGQNFSWIEQVGHRLEQRTTTTSRKPLRWSPKNLRWRRMRLFCEPIKGQSKTTKTRFCQLFQKDHTYWGKNLDRCWTKRIFNLGLWSVEETNSSSSSWKSTSRKRWSDWILENQRQSWGTVSLLSSLVWRQVEEYKGRRRKQQQISVLYWFFRRNSLSPSSSRSFWTQSYWFFITRQCLDSERLLPIHLSCRMCNQFIFHHQFGIDTWRSKFEQQTDSILHVCGSHGQKP